LKVATADKALKDAKNDFSDAQYKRGTRDQINEAQARYLVAQDAFKTANDNYSDLASQDDNNLTKAYALTVLGQVHLPDIGINTNDLKKNLTNVTNQAGQALQGAGEAIGQFDLPNDPADHRGILSWHAQKRDKTLHEAGSYGYLLSAAVPARALQAAADAKTIVIRFEVDSSLPGGLALYGERFGRYPLDPTLVFQLK